MSKRVAALLLMLLMFCAAGYAQTRVSIHSEVIITGPQITLGDVALIEGDDNQQLAVLRQIYLGSAPLPGSTIVLSRDILTTRLVASQVDFSQVKWEAVPPAIAITTGGQAISGQALANIARENLKARFPMRPQERIEVTLLQDIPDMIVPLGKISYEYAGQDIRFGVPQTVYLSILTNGILFTRVPVKCELKRFAAVVTAVEHIPARQVVTPDSVRLAETDVSRLPGGYITEIDKVVGLAVTRPVPKGAPLFSTQMEKPLLVKRGSTVLIVVKYGSVEAAAFGTAMTDGREDQYISVRNTATGKPVTARVVDKGRVEVSTYRQTR